MGCSVPDVYNDIFNPSFKSHIKTALKVAPLHLRNISKIRSILSESDAENLIRASITLRLEYCTTTSAACPNNILKILQLSQNAARVLTWFCQEGLRLSCPDPSIPAICSI